jgi:hypothetical protein
MAQLTYHYPLQLETNNKQPEPWHSSVAIILCSKTPTTNNWSHGTAQLQLSSAVRNQQLTTGAMAQLSCNYPLQLETNN